MSGYLYDAAKRGNVVIRWLGEVRHHREGLGHHPRLEDITTTRATTIVVV